MATEQDLHGQLAAAARSMQDQSSTLRTLQRSVLLATEILDGCDHAGVSVVQRDSGIDTPAATDDVVREADQLQYSTGEGPCLDAIWQHETVQSHDLAHDTRWPHWAPHVVTELGVASMLCFQLYTTGSTLGALNLYSNTVNGFGDDDVMAGTFLAAHMAVALANSQSSENLKSAGLSRTIIGQAQGILMERFDLAPEDAFAVLRRVSRDMNRKMHDIALELIATRRVPGDKPRLRGVQTDASEVAPSASGAAGGQGYGQAGG